MRLVGNEVGILLKKGKALKPTEKKILGISYRDKRNYLKKNAKQKENL